MFAEAPRTATPELVPLDEIQPRERAEARVRQEPEEAPSLPFSGFSVLALVLSGLAATSAGRRLRLAAR